MDLSFDSDSQRTLARLTGSLKVDDIENARPALSAVDRHAALVFQIAKDATLDTAGAWLLLKTAAERRKLGQSVSIETLSDAHRRLITVVENNLRDRVEPDPKEYGLVYGLETLGRGLHDGWRAMGEITAFLGQVIWHIILGILRPTRLRFTALFYHMKAICIDAVPIISLMAFLIGVVLAFQGAAQLRQFGAEIFVVDLIAISILRELGILLTAIIVAGRSGSAFTAAIGSMKMREEIDAMRTLGLEPVDVLVLPRVLAIVIMLPVLGFVADVMGLLGGAMMAWIELGVSPGAFVTRLNDGFDVWHYLIGLIKAPVFGLIIGVIGCYQGMNVGGNAESLGRLTSRSVVLSIITVLTADAIFSVFFQVVGV